MKLVISSLFVAAVAGAAHAQSYTTVFGPGGDAGLAIPDAAVLNGLESFTTFGSDANGQGVFANTANAGETLFFQIGPLYVGGAGPAASNPLSDLGFGNLGGSVANNRAYGVIGAGRSDIVFDAGEVDSVILQLRGTAAGLTTGPSPATNFGGNPVDLDDASGTVLIWTELGLEVSASIANSDFETLALDSADLLGDSITRISLINEGPSNSAVFLGELTVSLVPSPTSAALLGLGSLVAGRRRR